MLAIQQLLSGVDFARDNSAARQMANFAYLVADAGAGQCVLVDPAWEPEGLLAIAASRQLRVIAAVATHGHGDHVGGKLYGEKVLGMAELTALARVPVYCHRLEANKLLSQGIPKGDLRAVEDGDELAVGSGKIRFLHTPGHSPGSLCLQVGDALITGDTLFVRECGRIDLPGSEPELMFATMRKLAALPEKMLVYPGHDYGPTRTSTIGEECRTNPCLQPKTMEEWRLFCTT